MAKGPKKDLEAREAKRNRQRAVKIKNKKAKIKLAVSEGLRKIEAEERCAVFTYRDTASMVEKIKEMSMGTAPIIVDYVKRGGV